MNVSPPQSGSSSGRWTVAAMLLFGIVMVASLYVYWHFYTRPFIELQGIIAQQYPEATPRVIGGRYRSHEAGNPQTLRIILEFPPAGFDPEADPAASEALADKLVQLALEHQKLQSYELLEVHLIRRIPEQGERRWSRSAPISEWRKRLQG